MLGSHDPPDVQLPYLFVPKWDDLRPGDKVSVVLKDMVWENSVGIDCLVPGNQVVRVNRLIPPNALQDAHE